MIRVDIFCIPVTAFVLYCLVRSVRLLVIPAMTLAIAAALSYAATYFLGRYIMPVMPATPGLMSCLMISVSIDYAIFLLMRFREELPRQGPRSRLCRCKPGSRSKVANVVPVTVNTPRG